jgi:ferric-dicitrate binding protein FerR (iron transport regulator)
MNASPTDRIAKLIAAYGADRARWPAADRAEIESIDSAHDEARRAALELDALLDSLEAPPPRAGLRRDILLAVAREPRSGSRGLLAAWRALWRELGGARIAAPALVLALGVGLGLDWATTPAVSADGEDLLALVQFEESYPELDP